MKGGNPAALSPERSQAGTFKDDGGYGLCLCPGALGPAFCYSSRDPRGAITVIVISDDLAVAIA